MRFQQLYPLKEAYFSDLIVAVQDLMLLAIRRGETEIPTEQFRQNLARTGFRLTLKQVIQAVDNSNFASSVDQDKIVPKSMVPSELQAAGPEDSGAKVSDLAASQAKKDLK